MTAVRVLAGFFALWAAGAFALSLAAPHAAPLNPLGGPGAGLAANRLLAQYAAGVSLLAVYGMAAIAAGTTVSIAAFYTLIAVLVACWAVRRTRFRRTGAGARAALRHGLETPRDPWAALLLAATVALLLVLLVATLYDRLLWDAWAFWTFKAKALFIHGTLPDVLLDQHGRFFWTHPDYPLAVPLVDWWLYRHAGEELPLLAGQSGLVWHAFLPLLLWVGLREITGERWAAGTAFATTAFWPLATHAIGGYADIVLAVVVLAVAIELARVRRAGKADTLAARLSGHAEAAVPRIAVFLALAAVAKNEGLAIAMAGAAITGLSLWLVKSRSPRDFLWLLVPFLAIAPWWLFTRSLGLSPEHIGAAPTVVELVGRVPVLLLALADLATTRAWIPLPFLLILGVIARFRRSEPVGRAAWVFLLAYFGIILTVYLLTPLDLDWLLEHSLDRVILVLVPAAVFLSIGEIAST